MINIFNKIKLFLNNNPFFLPDVLILYSSLILVFYAEVISPWFGYFNYFILFITANFFIYQILYYWRNLPLSRASYIFFSLNILQLILYLKVFHALATGLDHPIYVENLSLFSQYRYLFFTIMGLFFISAFIITKSFRIDVSNFVAFFTFPYLKEEIRIILYSWNNTFFGDLCSNSIRLLYEHKKLRIYYFCSHFCLFYLLRIIILIFLCHFIFFDGDLRYIIYIVPLSFISWIFSFLDYYFITFFSGSSTYIRSLLIVTENVPVKVNSGVIETAVDNLSFVLSQEALNLGYTTGDISNLITPWLQLANLTVSFTKYNSIRHFVSIFLFNFQLILFCSISYKIYCRDFMFAWSIAFFKVSERTRLLFFKRAYATEAYFVPKPYQKNLEAASQGGYKGGHPILVDKAITNLEVSGEIKYEGQPTHGPGTKENPSYPLHPTKDLQGYSRPQNFVPSKTIQYIPSTWTDQTAIPGSEQYCKESIVKENMAKHTPQEEKT